MSNKQTINSINRNANFSLSQKRVLKDISNTAQQAVDNIVIPTPDPVTIYGGALISGSVTWLEGLTFGVSACVYNIDGVTYDSVPAVVTLDDADDTHPRIDVIYVDTDGGVGYITGTPAADPAKPEIDASTQLELTFVTVAANATAPAGYSVDLVYDENVGDPGEWDITESTAGARIASDSTTDPYANSTHIEFTEAENGDYLDATVGSGTFSVGDIGALETHVKAVSMDTTRSLRVAWFLGNQRVSKWATIKNNNFGFDSTNTSAYQTVTISAGDFGFTETLVDSVRFQIGGRGAPVTVRLDQVRIHAQGASIPYDDTQVLINSADIATNTLNIATLAGRSDSFITACSDLTSDLEVATNVGYWRAPYDLWVSEVILDVLTAPEGSSIDVTVKKNNVDLIGQPLKIDSERVSSLQSALVISWTPSKAVSKGDKITFDIDAVGSTVAGAGLQATVIAIREDDASA